MSNFSDPSQQQAEETSKSHFSANFFPAGATNFLIIFLFPAFSFQSLAAVVVTVSVSDTGVIAVVVVVDVVDVVVVVVTPSKLLVHNQNQVYRLAH